MIDKADEYTKLYRVIEISPRRHVLQLFKLYHNIPPGECGRGPYCLSWQRIKKSQLPWLEREVVRLGIMAYEELVTD